MKFLTIIFLSLLPLTTFAKDTEKSETEKFYIYINPLLVMCQQQQRGYYCQDNNSQYYPVDIELRRDEQGHQYGEYEVILDTLPGGVVIDYALRIDQQDSLYVVNMGIYQIVGQQRLPLAENKFEIYSLQEYFEPQYMQTSLGEIGNKWLYLPQLWIHPR